MKITKLCIGLFVVSALVLPAVAGPGDFDGSLHQTRVGKDYWYGTANGGFENWTGVPIEELGCTACHGPTDANGDPYDMPFEPGCGDCHPSSFFPVSMTQCYGCHGRQKTEYVKLGYSDVHRDMGMKCWDCHSSGDIHGDGTEYANMFEDGAIDTDCVDCHSDLLTLHPEHTGYDPHGGALHCTSCHTQSVISCYNCHFESQVESHVKRAKQPIHDFLLLVNRHKDGKVYPASFQSLTYQGDSFVAFAPYAAHTITAEGRGCTDCHNWAGTNAAINDYNDDGVIKFASLNDSGMLSWTHGVVPLPEDYEQSFKMDFITYDGNTSDPPAPSTNWSRIGEDTWDGHQLFFADPLSRDQMAALGFAYRVTFDMSQGTWNMVKNGVFPAKILGADGFDVTMIDVDSVMLEGVPVWKSSLGDSGAPWDGDSCDMSTGMPDGFMDLNVKFYARELAAAIGPVEDGATITLTLTGNLTDGTPIVGSDCVRTKQPNGRGVTRQMRQLQSEDEISDDSGADSVLGPRRGR